MLNQVVGRSDVAYGPPDGDAYNESAAPVTMLANGYVLAHPDYDTTYDLNQYRCIK